MNEPFTLGFRIKPDPGWHIYWKNAGDSGAAPKLTWSLNGANITPTQLSWPNPERIPVSFLMNYGYSDEIVLIAEFQAIQHLKEQLIVELSAEWLVCEENCIPAGALLRLTLPIKRGYESIQTSDHQELFEKARQQLPSDIAPTEVSIDQTEEILTLSLTPPESFNPNKDEIYFFSDIENVIKHAAPQKVSLVDNNATVEITKRRPGRLRSISGLVWSNKPWSNGKNSFYFSRIEDAQHSPTTQKTSFNTLFSPKSLLYIIISAFLGGILLNLMPCVFPVIALKIFALFGCASKPLKVRLHHSLLFTAGIIFSFLILLGFLLGLKQAGSSIGWGFQLQSPVMVSSLILLLVFLGLYFLGVFELGSRMQRVASSFDSSDGPLGSFMSGVLTTLVATPCTAPFMGAAIGYALAASVLKATLVFMFLGLGVATP